MYVYIYLCVCVCVCFSNFLYIFSHFFYINKMSSQSRKRTQLIQQYARRKTIKLAHLVNVPSKYVENVEVDSSDCLKKNSSVSELIYPNSYELYNENSCVSSRSDCLSSYEEFESILDFSCLDRVNLIEGKSINSAERLFKLISDSKSSNDESSVDILPTLREDLAQWAVKCSVPLTTVTALLKILRNHQCLDIPTQATTLLKNPRKSDITKKSGGEYTYFGIKDGVLRSIVTNNLDFVELVFNIDGLPIHKSTNMTLWPIQCRVDNIDKPSPFVVALFCGLQKPDSLEFLEDFTIELKNLMANGIIDNNGKIIQVKTKYFICDAPAKALIKGTVHYNGRYGCDYCDVEGTYDGRMMFLCTGTQRTDKTFREKTQKKHHKYISVLELLEVDMVQQFPPDVMHCVDLGCTKKLLLIWKEGPIPLRLSSGQINLLNFYLCSLKEYIPIEFNRKPRSLKDLKLWKASEFRTFLLYCGPVVLKYILCKEKYTHFLSLSVGLRILYSKALVAQYKDYAHELLCCFVNNTRVFYSDHLLTYNFHCLNHLAFTAEKHGCLDGVTAYSFENNMSAIKRMIRGPSQVIAQVARRLTEVIISESAKKAPAEIEKKCNFNPKTNECYCLNSGRFCVISLINKNSKTALIQVYTKTQNFFSSPCDSKRVGIYLVNNHHTEMLNISFNELLSKAIRIPLSLFEPDKPSSAVIVSLVHSFF
ncbi:uncharacterized protein LOC105843291 [Hydra vulgaris]|uniref:uncharacterized protein LOC105843291 n=1 Tax=Hydra vulgaris TaxID=6087 RepID=UPI001F5F2FF4|nr:uncharacterized protein LOC105843291 [Hydra vulgaris]